MCLHISFQVYLIYLFLYNLHVPIIHTTLEWHHPPYTYWIFSATSQLWKCLHFSIFLLQYHQHPLLYHLSLTILSFPRILRSPFSNWPKYSPSNLNFTVLIKPSLIELFLNSILCLYRLLSLFTPFHFFNSQPCLKFISLIILFIPLFSSDPSLLTSSWIQGNIYSYIPPFS